MLSLQKAQVSSLVKELRSQFLAKERERESRMQTQRFNNIITELTKRDVKWSAGLLSIVFYVGFLFAKKEEEVDQSLN